MLEQNGIPVLALIIEPLVAIVMLILTISGFMKFREKRRQPTLYLTLSFVFYTLAISSSGVGKWITFFTGALADGGTILMAYGFTALATVFLMVFVDLVFLDIGPWFITTVAVLNGLTVGMLILNLKFTEDVYESVGNIVIYHALLTLTLVLLLAILSFREANQNKEKLPKLGFTFIGLYGIFVSLVFVLFAIDNLLPDGYTAFYYLGWVSAGLGTLFGYVGYIMPDWFKKLIKVQ